MATNTNSASASSKPSRPDPERDLENKKLKLQEAQARAANATQEAKDANQEANSIQADIKAREAKMAEVKQLLAGYDAQKLQRLLDDENKVITTKSGIAEATLKDKKAAIDDAIKAFEDKLINLKTDADTARINYAKADDDSKMAANAAEVAQQAYEDTKKTPAKFDAWFKDIKDLLDQANKAETQSDYVALYFLVGEARKTAEKFKADPILPDDEYKKLLDAKLSDSGGASEDANIKKATADQALKDFNEKAKNYDAAKASRRTDLLSVLKKL